MPASISETASFQQKPITSPNFLEVAIHHVAFPLLPY